MPNACITPTEIELTPTGWTFVNPTDSKFTVSGTVDKIKVDNNNCLFYLDISNTGISVTFQYNAPGFSVPGTLIGLNLFLNQGKSTLLKQTNEGIILDISGGSFESIAGTPATNPGSDVLPKFGTWKISRNGQSEPPLLKVEN